MALIKKRKGVGGPVSSAGIMQFFDVSGGGLKLKPKLVLGIVVAFIIIEIIYNLIIRI